MIQFIDETWFDLPQRDPSGRFTGWTSGPFPLLTPHAPTAIMGILNITPDSFSDGGNFTKESTALAHASAMISAGATILDIGGESTRPGTHLIDADEECRRVIPILRAIRKRFPRVPISIDTWKASVARQALKAGADIINDISGFTFDDEMIGLIASSQALCVATHVTGKTPDKLHEPLAEADVLQAVLRDLSAKIDSAIQGSIPRHNILADPGIGFGKTTAQNLCLLSHIQELQRELKLPILIGASRKRFVGEVTQRDVAHRLPADVAICALCAHQGAQVLRVHDVGPALDAVKMVHALKHPCL